MAIAFGVKKGPPGSWGKEEQGQALGTGDQKRRGPDYVKGPSKRRLHC